MTRILVAALLVVGMVEVIRRARCLGAHESEARAIDRYCFAQAHCDRTLAPIRCRGWA